MYPMLQGGARMISQGGGPHPQALGPPGGAQFPAQGDAPQGPQQGIYGTFALNLHSWICVVYKYIKWQKPILININIF